MEQIVSGLERFGGVGGRMTILAGRNHARLIDDTYNANLRSVLTALDVLAAYQGKRIFVFGDMGELGDFAKEHHHEVGVSARNHGIDLVLTCGKHSEHTSRAFGSSAKHFTSHTELVHALIDTLDENTTVLVKGSRSAGMENIVQQLK
jgi:UDP-N-acetylmuramoyl-tripeptide--D-alanyl-D-alanine ligase